MLWWVHVLQCTQMISNHHVYDLFHTRLAFWQIWIHGMYVCKNRAYKDNWDDVTSQFNLGCLLHPISLKCSRVNVCYIFITMCCNQQHLLLFLLSCILPHSQTSLKNLNSTWLHYLLSLEVTTFWTSTIPLLYLLKVQHPDQQHNVQFIKMNLFESESCWTSNYNLDLD